MREHVIAVLAKHMPGKLKPSGGTNVLTTCPFHKGGNESTPSFSINVEKGVFHCFTGGCGVAGDLKYLLRLLGLPRDMVDAELKSIQPILDEQRALHKFEKENTFSRSDPFRADYVLPEALLGVYEWCPTALVEKGFDQQLLQDMEIGYDKRNERITYPLRDMYGNLAGIVGGSSLLWPKYKVYQGGRKGMDGRWIHGDFGDWFDKEHPGFRCENHDFLWNYHKVLPRVMSEKDATVYLAEGYKACMWMIQAGFVNTVALMGSYISDRQQQMLHRLGATIVLCLDNDAPGRKAALKVGDLLWRPMYGRIKVMQYPKDDVDTQPDDYEPEEVRNMVTSAHSFVDHVNNVRRT